MSATLPITDIKIGNRVRKDLGDLETLAASIEAVGLLQPIVIDADYNLVAGFRRIKACWLANVTEVPVVVAESVTDAMKHLIAERDENTCRKPFTPEEAVRMAEAIRGDIKAEVDAAATEAKREGGVKSGESRRGETNSGKKNTTLQEPPKRDNSRRTEAKVAKTVGMSQATLAKAEAVVKSGDEEAIQQMNDSGKVDPAFKKVKGVKGDSKQSRSQNYVDLRSEGKHSKKKFETLIENLRKCTKELSKRPAISISTVVAKQFAEEALRAAEHIESINKERE